VLDYTKTFDSKLPQVLIVENAEEAEHKIVLSKGFKAKSRKETEKQTKQTVYFNDCQVLSLHNVAPTLPESPGNGLQVTLLVQNNPRVVVANNLYAKKKLLLLNKKQEL
jgi:hypothetical protein